LLFIIDIEARKAEESKGLDTQVVLADWAYLQNMSIEYWLYNQCVSENKDIPPGEYLWKLKGIDGNFAQAVEYVA